VFIVAASKLLKDKMPGGLPPTMSAPMLSGKPKKRGKKTKFFSPMTLAMGGEVPKKNKTHQKKQGAGRKPGGGKRSKKRIRKRVERPKIEREKGSRTQNLKGLMDFSIAAPVPGRGLIQKEKSREGEKTQLGGGRVNQRSNGILQGNVMLSLTAGGVK